MSKVIASISNGSCLEDRAEFFIGQSEKEQQQQQQQRPLTAQPAEATITGKTKRTLQRFESIIRSTIKFRHDKY